MNSDYQNGIKWLKKHLETEYKKTGIWKGLEAEIRADERRKCKRVIETEGYDASPEVKELMDKARQEGWNDSAKIRKEHHCSKHGWACTYCESCIKEEKEEVRQTEMKVAVEQARASAYKCELCKDTKHEVGRICLNCHNERVKEERADEKTKILGEEQNWVAVGSPYYDGKIEQARAEALKEHRCSTWCEKHDRETEFCPDCEKEIRADERAKFVMEFKAPEGGGWCSLDTTAFSMMIAEVKQKAKAEGIEIGRAEWAEKHVKDTNTVFHHGYAKGQADLIKRIEHDGYFVKDQMSRRAWLEIHIEDWDAIKKASESSEANAPSLVSGGKRIITTPKPEKPETCDCRDCNGVFRPKKKVRT